MRRKPRENGLWIITLVSMLWIDFWESPTALQHCTFGQLIEITVLDSNEQGLW